MVAVGVLRGTPSQEGEGDPTSSSSPSAASRSNSFCEINIGDPLRKTNAVQLRPTFCGAGAKSTWSAKNGKVNASPSGSWSATTFASSVGIVYVQEVDN